MNRTEPALLKYLEGKSSKYAGKYLEVREVVSGWLSYVPQTFPHYTRHTVEHSDQIVTQLSHLLFTDDDDTKPILNLSAAEVYVLVTAALFHDCGMVTSDREKAEILESGAWIEWVGTGSGKERFAAIAAMRSEASGEVNSVRAFLADVQLRFLIAEFIRGRHHQRTGELLRQHQLVLGRFAFEDPILARTIEDICIGHGLTHAELDDDERFPIERDVLGDKVNVRLMAILFRLGDLLDLDSDRACPILLSAANPLPGNSLAHWTQYRCIHHRVTSPDRIEIHADCDDQEQHRVLADWCGWIQQETESARVLLAGSRRHADWQPPRVTIEPSGTIRIRASKGASYIPSTWKMELDAASVLERLVNDVYSHRLAFVREILQNAIDATRCQLYRDCSEAGLEWPNNPSTLPESVLVKYPIRVSLKTMEVRSELSSAAEPADILTIADVGIGMDAHTIERYFLQIGRSFYRTQEFRSQFPFAAVGRYGIGFLSIFGVSDRVIVETFKPSVTKDAIRLTLTGPRNYLLRERSVRTKAGTSISAVLKSRVDDDELLQSCRRWFRRVEFPIVVNLRGSEHVIHRENSADFEREEADFTGADRKIRVKAYPFATPSVDGELYVLEIVEGDRCRWGLSSWARYHYATRHPLAKVPEMPPTAVCENGICYDSRGSAWSPDASLRLDYRGASRRGRLDRENSMSLLGSSRDIGAVLREFPELSGELEGIIVNHLQSKTDHEWEYKQSLMDMLPVPFWEACKETIRLRSSEGHAVVSIRDAASLPVIVTVCSLRTFFRGLEDPDAVKFSSDEEIEATKDLREPCITGHDLRKLSKFTTSRISARRSIGSVRLTAGGVLVVAYKLGDANQDVTLNGKSGKSCYITQVSGTTAVGFRFAFFQDTQYTSSALLNSEHPLVVWARRVQVACAEGRFGLDSKAFNNLVERLIDPIGYGTLNKERALADYLAGWAEVPGSNGTLAAPKFEFDDFSYRALLKSAANYNGDLGEAVAPE